MPTETTPPQMPAEGPPREVMERILIEGLAHVIEPDRPPGLAAHTLARSVVALVRDRGGAGAGALAAELDALDELHPRGPDGLADEHGRDRVMFVGHFDVVGSDGSKVGSGGQLRQGGNLVFQVDGDESKFGRETAVLRTLAALGYEVRWTWREGG